MQQVNVFGLSTVQHSLRISQVHCLIWIVGIPSKDVAAIFTWSGLIYMLRSY